MGRLRRSRRWTAALSIAALLAVVASSGAALAEGDPPPATDAPTTTAAASDEPATTTNTAPGDDAADSDADATSADATSVAAATEPEDSGTAGAAAAGGGQGGAGEGGPTITQVGEADLEVSKTDAPDPVTAGSNISYTITATNNGPDAAANVLLQDQVTGIVTFVSFTQDTGPPAFCVFPAVGSPGSVNCSIANLAAEVTATFTLVVNVSPTAFTGAQALNPVSITSDTLDPNPTNNSEVEATTVQALLADLAVSKADSPDPVVPGANLTYTITAVNNGPNAASSVTVQEAIPFNTTFVSLAAPPGWSCTSPSVGGTGQVSCSIGSLPNGATAIFTLVVQVSPSAPNGSTITNNVFIQNQGTQDPSLGNNSGGAQTLVQSADVSVTKTDTPDPVPSGTNITYTITVANGGGGATAQSVSLSDTVPANTTFVSFNSPAGWTCTTPPVGGTGTVNCTIASLAPGASAGFTLVVHVGPGTSDGTVITNTATATSTTGDPNSGNNSATATSTVGPSADLAVTKADSADPAASDSNLTYTITVRNNGPGAAQSPTLTDAVTAGTTFVSVTAPAGWTCTAPPPGGTGTVSCSSASMAAGATAVFTLVVHITAPAFGDPLMNTASVASSTHDPNPNNNSDTEFTNVNPAFADVSVTKSDSPDPVVAGTTLNYTITVTNNGPSVAHNVNVTDANPGGVSFVSATPTQGSCSGLPLNVNCALGSIPSGATVTIAVVASVNPFTPNGFVIVNNVQVTASTFDPNNGNNFGQSTTNVVASADVSISKSDSPDPVLVGSQLTYTITVTNNGPSMAENPSWGDALPSGTEFVSLQQTTGGFFACATPAPGAGGTVSCTTTILSPGEVATFTLVVTVDAGVEPGTVISNTASARSGTSDPTPGNNSATATTTAVAETADLSVTKTDSPDPVTAGNNITYTITITNNGPNDAENVGFSDTPPANTGLVSFSIDSGPPANCSAAPVGSPAVPSCTFPAFPSGATATITVVMEVDADAPGGPATNTANVSTDTADPDPADDSASATTTVVPASADLSVSKVDSPDPVTAGNNITYTITITNNGPNDAQNVDFSDTPPPNTGHAGFSVDSGPPANCALVPIGSPGAPSCTFPTFPSGATATITLVVTVDADAPGGQATNTANVSSDTADPDPTDNTGTATTTVVPPSADLSVTKVDSPDPVTAGNNITYTITVTNNGPDDAQSVAFSDTFPANTTVQSFNLDSGPPSACSVGNLGASCTFPTFPSGASAVFTMVVTVDPDTTAATVTNTATATSPTGDPDPADNSATATTTVVPQQADLAVTKTDSPDPVNAGDNITYTITVTNNGPNDAEDVTVSDSVPADTTLVSFDQDSGPAGTCSVGTATVSCTYSSFPSGASAVFTMVVMVDPAVPAGTEISNTASATSDEVTAATADPNPANNAATAATTVAEDEVPGEGPGETPGRPAEPARPASPSGVGPVTAATAVVATPRFTG